MTKLEAYRIFRLEKYIWHLAIRYRFNEPLILAELREAHSASKELVLKLPANGRTLTYMLRRIESNKWLKSLT